MDSPSKPPAKKTQEEIAAIREEAAKKAAKKAAYVKQEKLDKAIWELVRAILAGHCDNIRFKTLMAAIEKCGITQMDAIRIVMSRLSGNEGLVLCLPYDVVALPFGDVVNAKQIKHLFYNSTKCDTHDKEFNPIGLQLIYEFYGAIIKYIKELLASEFPDGIVGEMNPEKFEKFKKIVFECGKRVIIWGMHVLGLYVGPSTTNPVSSWKTVGPDGHTVTHYAFRFVIEFDEIAGNSTAMPPGTAPTKLTAINGYLRRIVESSGTPGTPTRYVEATVTFDISDAGTVVRPGTWFPSALDSASANAGVQRSSMT